MIASTVATSSLSRVHHHRFPNDNVCHHPLTEAFTIYRLHRRSRRWAMPADAGAGHAGRRQPSASLGWSWPFSFDPTWLVDWAVRGKVIPDPAAPR